MNTAATNAAAHRECPCMSPRNPGLHDDDRG
jgi:hypothetical protein